MKTGLDKKDYLEDIQKILIFRSLTPIELDSIMEFAEIIAFDEGEVIVAEGDLSPSFFAVIQGTVHVTVKQDDSEVFICSIGPGDVFGEAAMFLKVKRTAKVACADKAVILKIIRPDMITFLKKQPYAGNKILMLIIYSLLKKLRDANQELAFERRTDIDQDDVDAILADFTKK